LSSGDFRFGRDYFEWGYATVSLSTKKIKGLHENDFIMASKIDRVIDCSGRSLDG
jgi:4a-hydroxytetrahydrobiopterin dehydratase